MTYTSHIPPILSTYYLNLEENAAMSQTCKKLQSICYEVISKIAQQTGYTGSMDRVEIIAYLKFCRTLIPKEYRVLNEMDKYDFEATLHHIKHLEGTKRDNLAIHFTNALLNPQNDIHNLSFALTHGAQLTFVDGEGNSPLHLNAFHGFEQNVSFLLSKNANVEAVNQRGQTPLHLGVSAERVAITHMLLEHGANPNATDIHNNLTPLHLAVTKKHTAIVSTLLDKHANPDSIDSTGATPLVLAAENQSLDIMTILLEKNAQPNIFDNEGITALHIAATLNNMAMVTLLLSHSAQTTLANNDGHTPLDLAILNNSEAVQPLLQNVPHTDH